MLSSTSIAKFKQGIDHQGSLYAILQNEQPILYFTLVIKKTSLVTSELIADVLYDTSDDDISTTQAIVTYCMLKLHQRGIYTVNRIQCHNTLVVLDKTTYKKLGDAICIV
jgi:hypothetical protein